VEGSSHAKTQLDSFIRFDRTPTCDGQTDRQTDAGPWLVPRMLSIARKNAAVVRLWTEKCRNAAGLKALVYTLTSFSPQN